MMESLLVPNDLQRHWLVSLVVKTLREERWRRGEKEGWRREKREARGRRERGKRGRLGEREEEGGRRM